MVNVKTLKTQAKPYMTQSMPVNAHFTYSGLVGAEVKNLAMLLCIV